MKRSRTSAPGLKHMAFFEALATVEESTPQYRAATAGLLALRLVDHWVLAGPVMVEPESVSVRSVREAIMAMAPNDPQREVLLGLVNAMQTLRAVDLQAIVPRIFAYAGTLERKGELTLAADAYESVLRTGDEECDATILIDSHMRLGFCRRMLGTLAEADAAFETAGKIARRFREPARALRSEIGRANVMMMRGNLPKAEEMLVSVCAMSERDGFAAEHAMALHVRAVVAQRRGNVDDAVCLAHASLKRTEIPSERDRILGDLAAFFILGERYDAARDALLILDATAQTANVRANARVNMVALAARAADRETFLRCREHVREFTLSAEAEVNYLIESARGFRRFGDMDQATSLLENARALAEKHSLSRSLFEAEQMLNARTTVESNTRGTVPVWNEDLSAHVVRDLRLMAAELEA